jgi:hypothetical protein
MTEQHVEGIRRRIEMMVAARQALRAAGSPELELEQNRLRIVRLQQELSRALIALYVPAPAEEAA